MNLIYPGLQAKEQRRRVRGTEAGGIHGGEDETGKDVLFVAVALR